MPPEGGGRGRGSRRRDPAAGNRDRKGLVASYATPVTVTMSQPTPRCGEDSVCTLEDLGWTEEH
ncbi:hypothetical protein, partial [Methanoculleus sp.]|uniref:hypothetical protein n=1 Tax=Methanoculleus sp. TaxID=90427 RepID=UPI0025D7386A